MLVLLHFFKLGYSPFTLSFLFLLYEFAGIVANLAGGWLATRFGIPAMLGVGQGLQVAGLLMLSALDPAWTALTSVVWVVAAQGVAGIAKDLTKTASKSAIKATSAEGAGHLFKWVAWFTGSKNAMKGAGFFVGGLLLDAIGFKPALYAAGGGDWTGLLVGVLTSLPHQLGKGEVIEVDARNFIAKSRGVNLLAAARVFLFGARDVCVRRGPASVPLCQWLAFRRGRRLPGRLDDRLRRHAGSCPDNWCRASPDGLSREIPAARSLGGLAGRCPSRTCAAAGASRLRRPDIVLVAGLALFGVPFAVNSSLHSYLILAYAKSEKAAEDVGFYYAANALGRLLGIILSGLLYQFGGMTACLVGSAVMLAICWLVTLLLPASDRSSRSARETTETGTSGRRKHP